ncbi:TraU family protein [Shewanella sp. MBTL60-007]|uniref:TraU family protein n=1 Tax=Shewanella sp. MBTL60-007 TaxID=2815911 RepID=UPI001BBEFEF9|nr:TraU family protein [Shewanella sp. MBTL60-007]GIU20861.1 hypothetical protein TUM3792_21000 [Shewanella sp. MBTL60-007]
MKKSLLAIGVALTLSFGTYSPKTDASDELSIVDLTQDHFNFQCVQMEVIGMCFWLKCRTFYCSVEYSILNSHYSPDLLVESKRGEASTSGFITDWLNSVVSSLAEVVLGFAPGQGTNTSKPLKHSRRSSLQFTDVNVIGSPDIVAIDQVYDSIFGATGYFEWCNSDVVPLFPYYSSQLDFEWRMGIYEMFAWPMNFNRIIHGMDSGVYTKWGDIFPRTGFITGDDPYITSSVNINKVADLITNDSHQWPHIYTAPPEAPDETKGWGYGKKVEMSDKAGKWQLNYPRDRGDSCYIFPDDKAFPETINSDNGNYVWTLWRKFKCCSKAGQLFLTKVEVSS